MTAHRHPRNLPSDNASPRRGFTLMELIVAAGMIGTLFLVTLPLLEYVRSVRQEADRRCVAQQEAANIMEHAAALALQNTLSEEALHELTLSSAAELLPEAEFTVSLQQDDGPLIGRRVEVRVSWTTDVGIAARPVTLTASFPPEGD